MEDLKIVQSETASKSVDVYSIKKIKTLKHFEVIWSKKNIKEILGEYIHMLLVIKNYRNFKKKSLSTIAPKQYEHAFKSTLEYAKDRFKILFKILKLKGLKFSNNGILDYSSLKKDLKKFVNEKIKSNEIIGKFIMTESLSKVGNKEYHQSRSLYETYPYIAKISAVIDVIKKLEKKLGKKVFIFPGVILNMKIKNRKFFAFDIDFCTKEKPKPYSADHHEEFRDFHYPFWIRTAITGNKIQIQVVSWRGGKENIMINETHNINRFKNYIEVYKYIAKKILKQGIIDKLRPSK